MTRESPSAAVLWRAFLSIVGSYSLLMGAFQGLIAVGVIALLAKP
jgi:hypothetical protein